MLRAQDDTMIRLNLSQVANTQGSNCGLLAMHPGPAPRLCAGLPTPHAFCLADSQQPTTDSHSLTPDTNALKRRADISHPTLDFCPASPHPRVNTVPTPRRIPTSLASLPFANVLTANDLQTRGEAILAE
jgi:hypothetical protein